MTLVRQLLVIALLPLMAWAGMPQVACQCSTGEVRLFCARLFIASVQALECEWAACVSNSCCAAEKAEKTGQTLPAVCCAGDCHCVPFVTAAGNQVAKENLDKISPTSRIEFVIETVSFDYLPRSSILGLILDSTPLPQSDLVVLFERFLI